MQTIASIVASILDIPETSVTDDLEYQSISEWDSLGHVKLMLALENAYNLQIDDSLVLKLTSIAAIKDFIKQCAKKMDPAGTYPTEPTVLCESSPSGKRPIERGLKNIFFDRTEITHIDIPRCDVLYRGYSIHELADNSTFEETAFLLLFGELPTFRELNSFGSELKNARSIPTQLVEFICQLKHMHPIHVLRTAVSALPAFGSPTDCSVESSIKNGIRLIAQIPTIVATHHRLRKGQLVVAPDSSLSHTANILYMLTGAKPTSQEVGYLEKDLIVHADHSSTPSTFSARVAAGTQADLYAAITSSIAAFGGDLHGNAPEKIIQMLFEIGVPENAQLYVSQKISHNEPIMGFGHRIYRTEDPRVRHLRKAAWELSKEMKRQDLFAIAEAVVKAMQPYARHGININDDFYSSIALHILGIPEYLFGSIAIMSRIVGLVAHVIEQYRNNIMFAASLKYVGRSASLYVSIEQRE